MGWWRLGDRGSTVITGSMPRARAALHPGVLRAAAARAIVRCDEARARRAAEPAAERAFLDAFAGGFDKYLANDWPRIIDDKGPQSGAWLNLPRQHGHSITP